MYPVMSCLVTDEDDCLFKVCFTFHLSSSYTVQENKLNDFKNKFLKINFQFGSSGESC